VKSNGFVFGVICALLAIFATVYWYMSRDPTGTTCLALSSGLAFLIAFYLLFTARRLEAQPEDRGDADISEGAGQIGHFSPGSWWPLAISASIVPLIFGVVYGLWLSAIGLVLLLVAVCGLLFEHYVGAAARDW